MPGERALATPSVEVGNVVVAIVPNTVTMVDGKGSKMVRAMSSGGDSVTMVITDDAETKKGMVKFSLPNTKTAVDLKRSWQDATNGVSIRLSDRKSSFQTSFRNMIVTEDPEVSLTADGVMEVSFEGPPAI
jgi:hypothetical protein